MKVALVAFGNEESYGLLFVGGELLEHGQNIKFFDAEGVNVVKSIVDWRPDFIMMSPMTTFYNHAIQVDRDVRSHLHHVVTVFGGHHAMARPEIIDDDEVDVVVVGPVRGSISQILSGTRGVIWTVPTTPSDISKPTRGQYYRDIPRMAGRYRKILLSTLGCPQGCSYCSSSARHIVDVFGSAAHKRYYLARRPLQTVIDEAKEIISYPTKEIEWVDDEAFFGTDIDDWADKFVDTWEREINLPMYVSTSSRFVLKVSDDVLRNFRRVVNVVGFGVQAIRPESLKLLGRGWDSEEKMKLAYDRLTSFGYKVNLQCIVGLPVDDPVDDAMDTIKGMQRIGAGSVCSCYPLMIYPGTKMECYCCENNIKLQDRCNGDTNSALPGILMNDTDEKRIRNICKLGTLFVKYNIDERWMRTLINVDFDDDTSKQLSLVRYRDCVVDRLGSTGRKVFDDILETMNMRY